MMMKLATIIFAAAAGSASAFTTSSKTLSRSTKSNNALYYSKSICTFDDTDFAGKTGDWPYTDADLNRLDNSVDTIFYDSPRFVTHIDDAAIAALTAFYKEEFTAINKDKLDVLDLCSSWISHLPEDVSYGKVVGVGMNAQELEANKQLTEHFVQDLNTNPDLSQFEDDSFDVICNVVSVDYLTKPLEIFQEMHRILRPGGVSLMTFSNRVSVQC
jgi:SAM-dependent methyltransferase